MVHGKSKIGWRDPKQAGESGWKRPAFFLCSLSHKVHSFLSASLVHLRLRIDWIMCGTRGNMLLPKGKTKKNGGKRHEKYLHAEK